jgi:hypothetical protein
LPLGNFSFLNWAVKEEMTLPEWGGPGLVPENISSLLFPVLVPESQGGVGATADLPAPNLEGRGKGQA